MSDKLAEVLEHELQSPESNASVVVRNKEMIQAIKDLKHEKGKIFIVSGKRHIFSDEDESIVQEDRELPPARQNAEQHELRTFLGRENFAVVLPIKTRP